MINKNEQKWKILYAILKELKGLGMTAPEAIEIVYKPITKK